MTLEEFREKTKDLPGDLTLNVGYESCGRWENEYHSIHDDDLWLAVDKSINGLFINCPGASREGQVTL